MKDIRVTDHNEMTLAVKVALNPNITNHPILLHSRAALTEAIAPEGRDQGSLVRNPAHSISFLSYFCVSAIDTCVSS